MKKNIFIILFLFPFFYISCNQSSSSNYMAFDDVIYIEEFPQIFTLENKIEPNIDIIGIQNFIICDSIMILSTNDEDGLWSFFSLPDYAYLGKFLTKGNGPFEFAQLPRASFNTKLFSENNSLFACIYDFQRGKVYKMDISKSILNNKLDISLVAELPPSIFNFEMIDSTIFLCKEVNNAHNQQIRRLYKNNEREDPIFLQKLNQVSIKEGEDINILSTSTKLNPTNNRIVEMPIGLNYLNIYSLDSSFMKTVCVGKTLDNIDKIQSINRWDRIYTFSDLRVFPDFFGVVFINEDEMTFFETGRKRHPSILLFNWNGEPLAELKLNSFITSFDIDFKSGELYTFDLYSDEFYKYNIKDILAKL